MLQSVMCRRIGLTKIGLTKLCFKDLYFLSRTFSDLPNVRGDSQKSKTPGRPSKPPDFSPAQQKGKISHNCRFKYLLWHTDGPSSVEQQSDGSSSPVVRPPEPVLPDIRSLSSSLKNRHFSQESKIIVHLFPCRDPEGFSKQGSGTLLIAPTGLQPRQRLISKC